MSMNPDTPRKSCHELYVEGLMNGKTKRQAALAAGFSKSQAYHPARSIEGPITQELLNRVLANAEVTLERLAQKLREGLDATKPLVLSGGWGKEETTKLLVDFETRLKYIQQACKILRMGESDDHKSDPGKMKITVVDSYEERRSQLEGGYVPSEL